MQLIRGLHNLGNLKNSAVTIGNFDGVHAGHKEIITQLVKKSKELNCAAVVISFFPSAQKFFGVQQATLTSLKEKHLLLQKLGVDKHLLIRFDKKFSCIEAEKFIEKILINKLDMQYCLIGDDFRFGKNRLGDYSLLNKLSQKYNFITKKTASIFYKKTRISSSKIRELLTNGEFNLATNMLGRDFSISGKIIHGEKKGATIGFPTINVPIKRDISPVLGVFTVTVALAGKIYNGVCNVGNRPTVNGSKTLLEVFLFDFHAQVYGQQVRVTFKNKLRAEKKFNSFLELKQQIALDVKNAKKLLKKQHNI